MDRQHQRRFEVILSNGIPQQTSPTLAGKPPNKNLLSPPIPYGLVGVGGFGRQHLTTLLNLERTGDVHLVAVCDPAIHLLSEVRGDLESRKVRIYEDYVEMLDRESLGAVTIAAPIPFHERMAAACLDRGLFAFLEKPPVPLLSQLDRLISSDPHARVAVGFQLIESDWSRKLKQMITAGQFGDLCEIRAGACWPRSDAYYNRARWAGRLVLDGEPVIDGPASNALSHLIHNIMFLASDHPEGFARPEQVQAEMYRVRPIESYDTCCVRGRLDSGASFFAAMTHASREALPYSLHIIGTKGWAKVSQDGRVAESHLGLLCDPIGLDDPMTATYGKFLDYVRGKVARPSTSLRDTEGYLLTSNGMLMSSGTIHTISPEWIDRSPEDGQYYLKAMNETVAKALLTSRLFSESDFPWAVPGDPISTSHEKIRGAHMGSLLEQVKSGGAGTPAGEAATGPALNPVVAGA